jgi:nicotinate phosphoribosyltransferase
MLVAFYKLGMHNLQGTMEAFTRKLPKHRRFMVVCGVERILDYLANLKITKEDIEIFKVVLPEIDFTDDICNYLANIDFSSVKVRAMYDGDLVFAQEPVVSISGPIGVIQYIEKKVLSILNHDVRIASKAARIYIASRGKPVFDYSGFGNKERPIAEFGGRRGADGNSAEAGRAAYIAGFSSTSNVLAYKRYGVPVSGTMGHVFVMSHLDENGEDGETKAYKNWASLFKNSTYLPDTYNLYSGTVKVLENCKRNIGSIRLDVDDLKSAAHSVRAKLNSYDHRETTIGATNDLNEYKIKELLESGTPIDWFGVGTEVVCTPDAPTCNFIYKLVQVEDSVVAKISSQGKSTLPGAKQVYRYYDEKLAKITHDVIGLENTNEETAMIELGYQTCLIGRNPTSADDRWKASLSRNLFLSTVKKMSQYLKVIEYQDEETAKYPIELSEGMRVAIEKFINEH